MSKIRKGLATVYASLAIICFLIGFVQAIFSWVLYVKYSNMYIYYGTAQQIKRHIHEAKIMGASYWWGGVFVSFMFVGNIVIRLNHFHSFDT